MEQPPFGQEVVGILADGSEILAMWVDGIWTVGVDNDPSDAIFDGQIVDWRWRTD